jgi:hypothetical protein
MWSSTVVCDPAELEHGCGNAVRDRRRGQIGRVQVPGQVFGECQVRPAMAEGVRVGDDGPETSLTSGPGRRPAGGVLPAYSGGGTVAVCSVPAPAFRSAPAASARAVRPLGAIFVAFGVLAGGTAGLGAGRPGTWLPRRRLRNGHGCAGRLVLER